MKAVGISACSNGKTSEYAAFHAELVRYLESLGYDVFQSHCIFAKDGIFSGTAAERASELMKLFVEPSVEEIYDVSGGDLANQILPYLDWEAIRRSKATFWGYSDLTTVLNAIYAKTGKLGVLYQVRHLVTGSFQAIQQHRFVERKELFSPHFSFVQGSSMEGIVVGGNIRCFLKLAGTPYFPDLQDKLLFLESLGGEVPQMATYLAQLNQLGVFKKVRGLLLGTFTTMEQKSCFPDVVTLVKEIAGTELPIAKTSEIGHGADSKAIVIGQTFKL